MSRHYDVMTSHERNPFSLSQSSVAQLLSNNSALANYATCRVSVITSYQDVSRLIVRNTNRIDINDLQTLCSTHLTSNPSPPSRTRRLSRTTGKLRWVLRLCKLRAFPSLHGDLRVLIQLIKEENSHLKRRVGVNLYTVSEEESDRTGRLQSGRLQL